MANQPNTAEKEIDLAQVSQKLRNAASKTSDSIFDAILFLKRNIVIVLILLVAGIALGIYADMTKIYSNKLYVIPNFGSVDYLYAKIDHLNSKIKENDKEYFKKLGFKNKITKFEIEPIVDIYKFIEGEENRNYDMFKLMTDNNDVSKVMEDQVTGRNFKRHVITFSTKGETSTKATIEPLMRYLNNSPYYRMIQKETVGNLQRKIATNDTTIKQIDAILNDFSRAKSSSGNSNLMYYNDNTQLNEVIRIKNKLIKEQGENKLDLMNSDKIIRDSEAVLNDKANRGILGSNAVIIPLFFIFVFVIINRFKAYYRSQMNKRLTASI